MTINYELTPNKEIEHYYSSKTLYYEMLEHFYNGYSELVFL